MHIVIYYQSQALAVHIYTLVSKIKEQLMAESTEGIVYNLSVIKGPPLLSRFLLLALGISVSLLRSYISP